MRVLFICSGNTNKPGTVVYNQALSLKSKEIQVDFFLIKGGGIAGYLRNIRPLRKHVKQNTYNLFHAHYALSAFVASLSCVSPLVVSMMGSDVRPYSFSIIGYKFFKFIGKFKNIIVKSERMKKLLRDKSSMVIPNGVNLNLFTELSKQTALQTLNWDDNKIHILFGGNPEKYVKNFSLAKKAVESLNNPNILLHAMGNVKHENVPLMMNAANVSLLTSRWEGSPNIAKEAMACNCPMVATDVGDIRWLFDNVEGYYVSNHSVLDVAEKLKNAIEFSVTSQKTKGREKIIQMGLDSDSVAERIIDVYKNSVSRK